MTCFGAEDEARTRDPNLGKVVLYQLSYFRIVLFFSFGIAKVDIFSLPPNFFATFFTFLCIFLQKTAKTGNFSTFLVNKSDFSHIAWFCFRGFVRISKSDTETELVSLGEPETVDIWFTQLVIGEESYRAAKADRSDTK